MTKTLHPRITNNGTVGNDTELEDDVIIKMPPKKKHKIKIKIRKVSKGKISKE